jgi:hypothetical protein
MLADRAIARPKLGPPTLTARLRDALVEHDGGADRIRVIPSGVNPALSTPSPDHT